MPLVSVIIPVYNAEAYIEKCVRSVINQTLKEIEIIIVNDGSTDNSSSLINKLAEEDIRIKVYGLQNKGVSAARNLGLSKVNGCWICFVDADDWIEPEMYEKLYNSAIRNDVDMVVCNVQVITDSTSNTRLKLYENVEEFSGKPEKAIEKMMEFRYDYANWNKLYNGEIIRQQQLRFDEHISIGEDLLFNLYYLHYIKKIAIVEQPLYQYRLHEESAMARSEDKRLQQYNLQFNAYKIFTVKYNLVKEWEVYRRTMSMGFYNTIIPAIIKNIKKQNSSSTVALKDFYSAIRQLDDELFYYPKKKLGLQGFKMMLLEKKQYFLFSSLIAFTSFLKSN